MGINELIAACHEYKELQRMQEEITAELDALKDRIRATMGDNAEMIAGEYKITNKTVSASRLDSKAVRAQYPDVAAACTISSVQTRFSIR